MEEDLFKSSDLDLIEDLINENFDLFSKNSEYQKHNLELGIVLEELEKCPKAIRTLFGRYDTAMLHTQCYENCLAYKIGLKQRNGNARNKIKIAYYINTYIIYYHYI